MHEYYFKIKKGEIEFEFSTTDKISFEEKLSDWTNKITKQNNIISTDKSINKENIEAEKPQTKRSDFIDIQNFSSINEIQIQDFSLFEEKQLDTNNITSKSLSFEDALKESIQNPKTEVIEKEESKSEFDEFVTSFNPESQMDYLIITALYLQNIEQLERFSIKQINSKIVPLTGNAIDHAMIQESIEQNYIKIIPDLTQTSELTEYALTDEGETYFIV